jgi:nucleoside-diphosphate-sugar epimerase
MRVIVIGGSGHVGTYLVPRLVENGHTVVNVSRGKRKPYHPDPAWASVEQVSMDRAEEEKRGTFGDKVVHLNPDVVIDMICFEPESARHLLQALRGRIQQLITCCTIWVHGYSVTVPTMEEQSKHPFGAYGIKKGEIESILLEEARKCGFPATVIHPGHIVGPGWAPVNPAGNFNPAVFETLARGEPFMLPNLGLETIHHVHAGDVAQIFIKVMENWRSATGESFHAVSEAATTLRGYAEAVAGWFGKKAVLQFLPWEQWRKSVSAEDAEYSWDHIAHSPCMSIEKAKRLLGYHPRYSSLEAVREAVTWLIENGKISTGPMNT